METIKYEAVFGDQSLFDGSPKDCFLVIRFDDKRKSFICGEVDYAGTAFSCDRYFEIAMRRIIKTPVWTVADQKAGRLPDVGALIVNAESGDQFSFVGINAGSKRWACMDVQDGFLYFFKPNEMSPIETPEERAQRLEDEWVIQQLNINTLPILTEKQWRQIHRAMLSCELQSQKDIK